MRRIGKPSNLRVPKQLGREECRQTKLLLGVAAAAVVGVVPNNFTHQLMGPHKRLEKMY
jgi:hypothetical protein